MGAIQSAINQALTIGTAIATQTPEYKAKVAEKEAEFKELRDIENYEKQAELKKEAYVNQANELAKKYNLPVGENNSFEWGGEDLAKLSDEERNEFYNSLKEHKAAMLKAANKRFDLRPNTENYQKLLTAKFNVGELEENIKMGEGERQRLEALEKASKEKANKRSQRDMISKGFKDLKGGKK